MKSILLPACLLFIITAALSAQTIRFVNHNASGNADGSSWANAFLRLQQALALAQDGDEIWIAKGTYKPSSTNDRYAFYNLPSGVKVYGGFVGTETLLEQRDWVANPTILSGDIGVLGDSTDNSFNILYSYSPNEKTRLDGLVFEEGNATNTDNSVGSHRPTRSGGGIYLDGENFGYAQLSVANCIFRRNRAHYQGGGIYANGREAGMAIVRLENCLFDRNWSGYFGGGLSVENYFEQPFAMDVKGCEFRDNYSFSSGNAIWLRAHQAVTFSDCKFFRNFSNGGGTVFFTQLESNHPVEFKGCTFEKNSKYAVFYSPNSQAINDFVFKLKSCVFSENVLPVVSISLNKIIEAKIENCLFKYNKNDNFPSSGGSVVALGAILNEKSVAFTNSLFFNNQGREIATPTARINNCIFIDELNPNYTSNGIFWGSGPFNVSNSLFRLQHCDSLGRHYNGPALTVCDSTNLFGIDPLFVNPLLSDFHLQPCSPAINAGVNAILDSLGITTDLDGNPRIRNEVVDMGPYETYVSLQPGVSAQPACAGERDGAIEFSPDICPPFSFVWSNGVNTGINTDGLAAGTYIFSATGANNIPVSDTIVISEPAPLAVVAQGYDVTCYGNSSGWVEALASGGTPPYTYTWEGIVSPFGLPSGTYTVNVVDANGCTASAQATVASADPIQVFYTTQNVSCMACADGSVVFDSIIGGTNPPLPPSLFNLTSGVYCFTVTDAVGCHVVVCFTINVMSGTKEESIEALLKLSPNPTASGENATLEWLGNEQAALRVLDLQGKMLEEKQLAQNATVELRASWPAGIYQVEIRTESGRRAVRRWVIF